MYFFCVSMLSFVVFCFHLSISNHHYFFKKEKENYWFIWILLHLFQFFQFFYFNPGPYDYGYSLGRVYIEKMFYFLNGWPKALHLTLSPSLVSFHESWGLLLTFASVCIQFNMNEYFMHMHDLRFKLMFNNNHIL